MKRWWIKVVIGAGVLALCVANRSVACGGTCMFGSFYVTRTIGSGCSTNDCKLKYLAEVTYSAQGVSYGWCYMSSPDGTVKDAFPGACTGGAIPNGFVSNEWWIFCATDCNQHNFYVKTVFHCPEGTFATDSVPFWAKSKVSPCACP